MKTEKYIGYIGYIRYEGDLVKEGLMDARKQAQALLAIDHALRYFIAEQVPEAHDLEFEIPVKIREGSWEALIPTFIAAGLGAMITAYFVRAGYLMANKDFADIGVTDLFRKSLNMMKWFVKIVKHMGKPYSKSRDNTIFSGDEIGIRNANGKYLYVPKDILDIYIRCSPQLLEKLAENVEDGRDLIIGSILNGEVDEVVINLNDKNIFLKHDTDEDVILPELVHGKHVELEGEVMSENKTSNSMGFEYKKMF